MRSFNDPVGLYRQIRITQRQAEQGGFINTAAALAGIAEMIALEAGVDAVGIESSLAPAMPLSVGALPIYRMARC